jgi:hypothetical protein
VTSKLALLLSGALLAAAGILRLPAVGHLEERLVKWAALREYADDDERRRDRAEEWPGLVRDRAGFSALATALSFFLPVLFETAIKHVSRLVRRGTRFPRSASGYLQRVRRNLVLPRPRLGLTRDLRHSDLSSPRDRERAFRLVMAGSSISMLGSRIASVAYPLLILHVTGSPLATGMAVFAAVTPGLLAYAPAIAWVDRWDARRVMLVSETGRGYAIVAAVIALLLHEASIPLLTMAAGVEGTLGTFTILAERRYVGALLEPGRPSSALIRTEVRAHAVSLAGPLLAGFLLATEPILPFLAASVSVVYSVTAFMAAPRAATPASPQPSSRQSCKKDIADGLRRLRQDTYARTAAVLSAAATFILQALVMVFLVSWHAHWVPFTYVGAVLAVRGLGRLLGAIAGRRLVAWARFSMTRWQMAVWSAALAVAAVAGRSLLCTALVMAVLGFTSVLSETETDVHLLVHAEGSNLAKVTLVNQLLTFSASATGPVLGALLAQEFGAGLAAYCLTLATAGLALMSLLSPALRPRPTSQRGAPSAPWDREVPAPADAQPPSLRLDRKPRPSHSVTAYTSSR